MSWHTSLSDQCNSVPSSPSVIHSEPLVTILVARSRSKLQTLLLTLLETSSWSESAQIWSTNDFIHNRKWKGWLTEYRVRDFVYIHSNLKLLQRSRSIARKQTSTGNVGQCHILTAVNRNNKQKQPYIRVSPK